MYQSNNPRSDRDAVLGSILSVMILYVWLVILGVWIVVRWLVRLAGLALDYVKSD